MATMTEVASPCIKQCKLDDSRRYCTGCLRTLDEITGWSSASNAQKQAALASPCRCASCTARNAAAPLPAARVAARAAAGAPTCRHWPALPTPAATACARPACTWRQQAAKAHAQKPCGQPCSGWPQGFCLGYARPGQRRWRVRLPSKPHSASSRIGSSGRGSTNTDSAATSACSAPSKCAAAARSMAACKAGSRLKRASVR